MFNQTLDTKIWWTIYNKFITKIFGNLTGLLETSSQTSTQAPDQSTDSTTIEANYSSQIETTGSEQTTYTDEDVQTSTEQSEHFITTVFIADDPTSAADSTSIAAVESTSLGKDDNC